MDSVRTPLSEIYLRQENLESYSDTSAMVIGAGGVGSWIGLDLALLGVGTLVLVDPDLLESSNLNRTLFKLDQIGTHKTVALKKLIRERRPDCIVITIEDYFQNSMLKKYEVDYIFDATDNLATRKMIHDFSQLDKSKSQIPYSKVGYDGFRATISFNDFESGRWGDDGSYTMVPSFFGTPQVLSALVVIEMLMVNSEQISSTNFNVKKILNKIVECQ